MARRRRLLRFESKGDPLAPMSVYLWRILKSILGYAHLEKLSWLDAFLNAAMILGGMGPVATLQTDAGKLFAGCYALYSGLVVVLATGIALAPIAHRVLHRFNADDDD